MAVISVPRELREKLGDPATDSLVDLLHQFGNEQRQDLIAVVEERFARHVADSRDALRSEMHAGFLDLQKQLLDQQQQLTSMAKEIGSVRADLTKEIGSVRADLTKEIGSMRADLTKEIGSVRADLRKEITVQTRWLLTVLVAATILIPVMQRVLGAAFP